MKIVQLATDAREHAKDYGAVVPYFGTAPEALFQGFAQIPDLEVHIVSCTQQPMQSPAKIAPNIFFHSLHVPKLGWMRTLYQGCIRASRAKIREIQPNLVHGQGTERDCAISAVLSGFPNLLTIHGNMRLIARVNRARLFSFAWLAARLERMTVPHSDGVVCISGYTRDAVAPLAKRTWVVPNGVNGEFFDVNPAPDRQSVATILCVGLVCPRKNQNAFIRALDPVAARRKLRVVFLGHTVKGRAYDEEFFELISSRPWCVYDGFADREKLKRWFSETSFLALPSLEDNCPMAVLEAMAAGVPVLAAKVGGVPDLVEEEKTGVFCDPLDPASMRAGAERLLEKQELGLQLGATARNRARDRFHPRVIAARHVEIYREVLNRPS